MSNRRKPFILTALSMAMLLILAGCGGGAKTAEQPKNTSSKESIKIGVVSPLTGASALWGQREYKGIQLAVEEINNAGGILGGKPIEIVLGDDQGNPEVGVSEVKKLMGQGVNAIVGGLNSSVALAEIQVTKNANMLHFTTASQAVNVRQQGHPFALFGATTTEMDGQYYNTWIKDTLKPQTVTLLLENTDWGRSSADTIKSAWANSGSPKILDTVFVNTSDSDFTVVLTKIKGQNPDLIYMVIGSDNTLATILTQLKEVGYKGKKLIPGAGGVSDPVLKLAGDAADGLISSAVWFNSIDNPESKQFVEAYKKKFKGELPEIQSVNGYDNIKILAKAMDTAGTATDYAKIVKEVENNTWKSARGDLKFDSNGQVQIPKMLVLEIKNGKRTLLN